MCVPTEWALKKIDVHTEGALKKLMHTPSVRYKLMRTLSVRLNILALRII